MNRRFWLIIAALFALAWPLLFLIGCQAQPVSLASYADGARARYAELVERSEADPSGNPADEASSLGPAAFEWGPDVVSDVAQTPHSGASLSDQGREFSVVSCACLSGGDCLCEANGCACLCGPKPSHQVFREYGSPCVLVFGARWCTNCTWSDINIVPDLVRRGWNVQHIDVEDEAWKREACQVEGLPAFICVRRGVECGRYEGIDRSQLFAMLRHALELRFPEDDE